MCACMHAHTHMHVCVCVHMQYVCARAQAHTHMRACVCVREKDRQTERERHIYGWGTANIITPPVCCNPISIQQAINSHDS